MTKGTSAMINNLETKLYTHIDKIIQDPFYDPSLLIDDFKAVYSEVKKDTPSEFNITNINYEIDESLLNSLIVQNTLINGNDSLNELSLETAEKFDYQKQIIKSVRNRQLECLKEFILKNQIDTPLIYYYHELYILQKIINKEYTGVLPYIREYFVEKNDVTDILKLRYDIHSEKVKKLLTFLVLPDKVVKYNASVVQATIVQLKHDFNDKMNISNFACLDVLFTGGTESIEQLLKITSLEAKQFGDCLPIDLNIKTKYHSIFICPILKTFCGDDNPPLRLKCGHVISKEAVERLSKNKGLLSFKCPYCPNDCRLSEIKRLYL